MEYPINRFAMETKRQLHVLDTHLVDSEYMVGGEYTIADMAIFPWYGNIMRNSYNAADFLSVHEYAHVERWVSQLEARATVQRGRMVNRTFGGPESQLRERHDARDFDMNREDMVQARAGQRL
jgi:GST-like protein